MCFFFKSGRKIVENSYYTIGWLKNTQFELSKGVQISTVFSVLNFWILYCFSFRILISFWVCRSVLISNKMDDWMSASFSYCQEDYFVGPLVQLLFNRSLRRANMLAWWQNVSVPAHLPEKLNQFFSFSQKNG